MAEYEVPAGADQQLAAVTQIFRTTCEELHAEVFTEGADRHGSLVWEAGWQHDGSRFLTVSVRTGELWQMQVWAAASDERAYSRQLLYETTTVQVPPPALREALLYAAAVANTIQPGEPDRLGALQTHLAPSGITMRSAEKPGGVSISDISEQLSRIGLDMSHVSMSLEQTYSTLLHTSTLSPTATIVLLPLLAATRGLIASTLEQLENLGVGRPVQEKSNVEHRAWDKN